MYAPTVWRNEPGVSPESKALGDLQVSARRHSLETFSFGWRNRLKDRLLEVAGETTEEDWDGYGAHPISGEACEAALRLIELFPEGILVPDIVPLPSGELGFEWRTDSGLVFSISTRGRTLVYAGILGGERKQYGEEPVFEDLPQGTAEILSGLFGEAG